MPTSRGTFAHNDGNKFISTFFIDGSPLVCLGQFTPEIQPFNTNNVTITYHSPNDMASNHQFNGHIGPSDIELTFVNGVTVKGSLNEPIVSGHGSGSGQHVNGTGMWMRH
ncbi:hypothetical protein NXS19_012847 [Fusarium pseudograminearum]|uniref:Uncharacterized protein n=1 Tax=Fusarium pseudograminearum (strain CS3096) TaxID=1028729 RepID=K3VE72_FUSPC|nr:hypothetical protein FPSE_08924 [Fusarium pseudograminearum CS3096]EKJ70873.1 hypothetical protein FPSE_08924 [Fusarium pseudograminearum CS3096]UZP45035.1 hypothetical protein NXS19_012847 [Fusarium pseudograminearum]